MYHEKTTMEEFVIHRGELPVNAPKRDSESSRLMELLRSIDSQMFLKKLVQFRNEFQDCDFDSEINACKLYYSQGRKDMVLSVLEEIRRKMLNYGENLLMRRMQNGEEIGDLGRLPADVMRLIFN